MTAITIKTAWVNASRSLYNLFSVRSFLMGLKFVSEQKWGMKKIFLNITLFFFLIFSINFHRRSFWTDIGGLLFQLLVQLKRIFT